MNIEDFDPGLFGRWGADGYCGDQACDDGGMRRAADAVLLEIKSAEAAASGADLRVLLNDITAELKVQLAAFTALRKDAQAGLCDPEADQKQARADLKTSNDAIALIVRTLDKTDELQRKINDARDAEAERNLDEAQLRTLCDGLNRHIEARAAEIAAGAAGEDTVRAAAGRNEDGPG